MIFFIIYIVIALITAIIAYSIFDDIDPTLGVAVMWPVLIIMGIVVGLVHIFIAIPGRLLRKHINPTLEDKWQEIMFNLKKDKK